ncbi:hypothetical protein D3C87_1615500 [compost metagenome]
MQRHQLQMPFVARNQALAPDLGGLKRHLQHLAGNGRVVVERGNAVDVGFVEAFEGNDRVAGAHG